jgi:predicted short-subunit dehydrogenase-like oxidoreductase (DUF2520 family)
MAKLFSKIAVIGAGQVGTALSLQLRKRGKNIVFVSSRTKASTKRSAQVLHSREFSITLSDLPADAELIIIATPAQAIPGIVKQLAHLRKIDIRGKFIIHTSGAHSSVLLDPLRKKGAKIASVHPMQTFPQKRNTVPDLQNLRGIYYGIEAPAKMLPDAKALVKMLGGKYVVVPERHRALYHAVCVFSSGYIVQLLNIIEAISTQLNFGAHWYKILGPLMETSIINSVKSSPPSALTGPIMRGDLATVKLHLQTLRRHAPSAVNVYKAIGAESARVAFKKKSIGRSMFNKLRRILSL